jgi:hypothetical protein
MVSLALMCIEEQEKLEVRRRRRALKAADTDVILPRDLAVPRLPHKGGITLTLVSPKDIKN